MISHNQGAQSSFGACAFFLVALGVAIIPAGARAQVVSTELCADQMVVAVVGAGRLTALSPQARDPRLSVVAAQDEGGAAVLPPAAEAFVLANAKVVVGMAWDKTRALALMERLGARIIRLDVPDDFAAIAALLRSFAVALGVPERGESLAADLERRVAALAARQPAQPVRAIYLRPDGGSAGWGTFVDAVLTAAGFENAITAPGWIRLDLETLVMNPPKVIIAAFFDSPGWSRLFSRHPVFRTLWHEVPVIEVPGALMACGAWPLIIAAERLAHHRLSNAGLGTRSRTEGATTSPGVGLF